MSIYFVPRGREYFTLFLNLMIDVYEYFIDPQLLRFRLPLR